MPRIYKGFWNIKYTLFAPFGVSVGGGLKWIWDKTFYECSAITNIYHNVWVNFRLHRFQLASLNTQVIIVVLPVEPLTPKSTSILRLKQLIANEVLLYF